jgi:hypothetical protein
MFKVSLNEAMQEQKNQKFKLQTIFILPTLVGFKER